jgi:hypothetical protein
MHLLRHDFTLIYFCGQSDFDLAGAFKVFE